jgi:hypothetical protein
MVILAKIGERLYEFEAEEDLTLARALMYEEIAVHTAILRI